jgi:hypothetical protein
MQHAKRACTAQPHSLRAPCTPWHKGKQLEIGQIHRFWSHAAAPAVYWDSHSCWPHSLPVLLPGTCNLHLLYMPSAGAIACISSTMACCGQPQHSHSGNPCVEQASRLCVILMRHAQCCFRCVCFDPTASDSSHGLCACACAACVMHYMDCVHVLHAVLEQARGKAAS